LAGAPINKAIAERLLSISGEDTITVDRKYSEAWTGRSQTRFIIMSNELPRLADASGALDGRCVVLLLTWSFYGKEDLGLTERPLGELPGILNWALIGWRRLTERGYFMQPRSALDAVQMLADLSSPIRAFLQGHREFKVGYRVTVDDLYYAWRDWCSDQGRDRPVPTRVLAATCSPPSHGCRRTDPEMARIVRDSTTGSGSNDPWLAIPPGVSGSFAGVFGVVRNGPRGLLLYA